MLPNPWLNGLVEASLLLEVSQFWDIELQPKSAPMCPRSGASLSGASSTGEGIGV